jgi:hypothetical protein
VSSDIAEYFAKFTYSPEPEQGAKPVEVVWKRVGDLQVTGTRLYIGDSWSIGADSTDIPASPGTYEIDAKCFSYGTDGRVAVLRGRLRGSEPDDREDAGEFGVDVGSAGVMDADALDGWADSNEVAYEEWLQSFTDAQCESHVIAGFFPCEPIGSAMLFTSTGFGDGSYKAVCLMEHGKPVGFEAHFLKDGHGYFEDDDS